MCAQCSNDREEEASRVFASATPATFAELIFYAEVASEHGEMRPSVFRKA